MSEAIRKQYCVGGVWKDSKTEKWMPVTDSSTGEVIAEVPSCTPVSYTHLTLPTNREV